MPVYYAPESHAARIAFLQRAAITGQADITAGRNYVTQTTVDAINTFTPNYGNALSAIPVTSVGRSKEIRERNEAIDTLSTYTRDFWEVLKRRVNRLNEPVEVLQYYGLPQDGTVPRPTTPDEWIQKASICVAGDANAVTAGFPAMVNPSAAEVDALVTAAQTEANEVADADRLQDEALAAADALVEEANTLIEDVMAELRFNLRKMDYPSQRRIQRTYGARFRTLPGEPSEGDRTEVIATGDGTETTFNATLQHTPVEAGTLTITDGVEVLTDTDNGDGTGVLNGIAGGSGSINYSTGEVIVTFTNAPLDGVEVQATYVGGVV